MIEIVVNGSTRPALVDDEFKRLAGYRWRFGKGAVFRYGDRRIKLSHVIAGVPPPGYGVVHRNGDSMDFRRENLETVTEATYLARARAKRTRPLVDQGDLFAVTA